jgi:ATP-dependent Clp protease ATP-binding subunit ClpC
MGSGINSEHILLSLATTTGTIAYELLHDHLINIDQIRLILSLRGRETTLQSGISPYAKHVLDLAIQAAHENGHIHVDAEHLLLGIVTYPECLAYQIIARIGIDPKILKKQILRLFDELNRLDTPITNIEMDQDNLAPEGLPMYKKSRLPKQKSSSLEYFATNLTNEALNNNLDPVIGRDVEIQRLIQILARRTKNNPVLIGDPGVGKTAIVEGLAQRINDQKVPPVLKDKQIYQLDLGLVIAGTTYRGQFEERLKKIMQEVKKNSNMILFIDEIHTIVGAGSAEGSLDAANILKPALAKGEVRIIGATTTEEYRKHIEKDAALERRLQKIIISETTIEETISILKGLKKTYEQFHNVSISNGAIEAAAQYSKRFIADRQLPDKAIDLIDEAASAVHLKRVIQPQPELEKWQKEFQMVVSKKEAALQKQDYDKASSYRAQELKLLSQRPPLKKEPKANREIVTEDDIAAVVTATTGIPIGNILKEERLKLANLEKILSNLVIGQDEAIKSIAAAIRRSKAGISNPNRPLGSFLFLGPTGVGKTYLTQALAKTVYGSEKSLIKIDMSEFMERHNTSRLVGAPPGYVGYEEGGKLTEVIRRQPFSVVLLDEIEKAHPEVFNLLLQVLEDGHLTDSNGRIVSFKHTIIIMTSNIGSHRLTNQAAIGFRDPNHKTQEDYQLVKEDVLKELEDHFRPEFLNRLDKTIVFNPLDKKTIEKIIDKELDQLSTRLKPEGYRLIISKKAKQFLVEKGFDSKYGVRPLRRAISDFLEGPLADLLLSQDITKPAVINVDADHSHLILTPKKQIRAGNGPRIN